MGMRLGTPAFNVFEPFQDCMVVAMNGSMIRLLADFLHDVADEESDQNDSTNYGIAILSCALNDRPHTDLRSSSPETWVLFDKNAARTYASATKLFAIAECGNVIILTLSNSFSISLQRLIDRYDVERELVALRRALGDPHLSREIRDKKFSERDREPRDQREREPRDYRDHKESIDRDPRDDVRRGREDFAVV